MTIVMIPPEQAREFLLTAERELKTRIKLELSSPKVLSYERAYLLAAAKRTLALGHGFRAMEDSQNATVAATLVRVHLDTLLRLYALWWVKDSEAFSRQVMDKGQINRMKDTKGVQMTDGYLYKKLAKIVPWIETVYQESSGFVHFSHRHMLATMDVRGDQSGSFELNVEALDASRAPTYYRELAASFTDITVRVSHAISERLDILETMPDPKQPLGALG